MLVVETLTLWAASTYQVMTSTAPRETSCIIVKYMAKDSHAPKAAQNSINTCTQRMVITILLDASLTRRITKLLLTTKANLNHQINAERRLKRRVMLFLLFKTKENATLVRLVSPMTSTAMHLTKDSATVHLEAPTQTWFTSRKE